MQTSNQRKEVKKLAKKRDDKEGEMGAKTNGI